MFLGTWSFLGFWSVKVLCCNPSLGFTTKARVCEGAGQKWTRESHFMLPRVQKSWGNEPPHSQVSSHFESWSPNGLSNLQRVITGVKTYWIEKFLISLESSWNINVWNGLTWPIWTFQTQVMAKRRVRNQIGNLIHDH